MVRRPPKYTNQSCLRREDAVNRESEESHLGRFEQFQPSYRLVLASTQLHIVRISFFVGVGRLAWSWCVAL